MGHDSEAFAFDTCGHLMDRIPVHPVEWIDDLVFPEGTALILHLSGAPSGTTGGHGMHSADERKPNTGAGSSDSVPSGAVRCVVGGAGLEPDLAPRQPRPVDDGDLLGTA